MTEFTFKDGDVEMKAQITGEGDEAKWSFAAVEHEETADNKDEKPVSPNVPKTPTAESTKQDVAGADTKVPKFKVLESLFSKKENLENASRVESVITADKIDAAFANTNTVVAANNNVAKLPATGAASNVALILSSAALAVVGLFLKK